MAELEILNIAIDQLDFQDRYGQWRITRGCSIKGRDQFRAYIQKLDTVLKDIDDQTPVTELYNSNDVFRYICDRCLELNQIDPDWLDGAGALLSALLFRHEDGPGMLVRLNMVEEKSGMPKGEPATNADIAASILAATNDLKQAMDALEHPDGKFMLQTLQSRAKQIRDAESRSKKRSPKFEEWKQQRQEKIKKEGAKPVRLSDLEAKR